MELTRLVAVDSHVFQPKKQRLEGSDAILSHLKRADSPALAQGAAQLMRSVRADDERTFDAVDGEWVPSHGERVREGHDLALMLADLRAEFVMLRASHQRLKDRVVALEAQIADGVQVPPKKAPAVASPVSVARVSFAPASKRGEPASAVPMPATFPEGPSNPTLATGQEPAPARSIPPVGEVHAAISKRPAPTKKVELGSDTDLLAALKDLFSGDPGYAKTNEPVPDSALELAALYASLLVDDDGNELGAVLADIRATANLGGRLVGLPATVIDEQAKTGVLSEPVTAAMSEVCNTLSAALSRVPGNVQLRSTPLESFSADRLRWVGSARSVIALEKKRAGTFWLVTR